MPHLSLLLYSLCSALASGSDKEAIRPLYRDFKALDKQIQVAEQAEEAHRENADPCPSGATAPTTSEVSSHVQENSDVAEQNSTAFAAAAVDNTAASGLGVAASDTHGVTVSPSAAGDVRRVHHAEQKSVALGNSAEEKPDSLETELQEAKAKRHAKRREIQLWIKDFEAREGRPPNYE